MALTMTQTPTMSFKSSMGDARPFLSGRTVTVTRTLRTSVIPMARGPSLKPKNNIAKVIADVPRLLRCHPCGHTHFMSLQFCSIVNQH